jgi:ketosteroid isomerase-like protein
VFHSESYKQTFLGVVPFRYLVSGGVPMRAIMPGRATSLWKFIERAPSPGRTASVQRSHETVAIFQIPGVVFWAMPSTLDQIKRSMQSTNDLFNAEVFGKRNFAALDDIYTRGARILPPGAPMISGRDAIRKFWSDLVLSANARSAVLDSVDVMAAGDGVVEIGRATLTVEPPGQSATQMEVKYVVYWLQEDSRWKWHVDIWNQNS